MNPEDISNIQAESGIIATLIRHPEFIFYSESLLPSHFTNTQNAFVYAAISILVKKGVTTIDPFNIINALESDETTKQYANRIQVESLQDFIAMSDGIVRHDAQGYKLLVDNVLDAALRRDVLTKLRECEALCMQEGQTDLEQKIYSVMDSVLMAYTRTNEIPQYKDVVESLWEEIKTRQSEGMSGIPFKFQSLNNYVKIEPGELIVFAADAKQGKSMMLLNCAVDLMHQGKRILYIDSELNSRLFTCRLLSHIAQVRFMDVRDGTYTELEGQRINQAIDWLKTTAFTHIYMPIFDEKTIYTTVKKVFHTQGIDVLIIDYFKSGGDGDAFTTYQELGKLVNTVKNKLCGDMNICGLAAAQATATGKIADSAKIARNASTIIMIQSKTPSEIMDDGQECGNKKLRVVLNRNGMQMAPDEYIDLQFNGDYISYEEATQHMVPEPF